MLALGEVVVPLRLQVEPVRVAIARRKGRFVWKVCLFECTGQFVYNQSCLRLVGSGGEDTYELFFA